MKKGIYAGLLLMFLLGLCACSFQFGTPEPDQVQQNEGEIEEEPQEPGQEQQEEESQEPGQEQQEEPAELSISHDLFIQSMEALNSYRRKVKIDTIFEEQKTEEYMEWAYVREPLSIHTLQDYVTSGRYIEDIIIGDTLWTREEKDGSWEKYLAGNWQKDPPPAFGYKLDLLFHPIDYEKLTFEPAGSEQVNGINCVKYNVSGSYAGEFSVQYSEQKYPIKLSAVGNIWIADGPVIRQAIIRQRITLNTDIENPFLQDDQGNPVHIISENIIEDDVLEVNATVIEPPEEETGQS